MITTTFTAGQTYKVKGSSITITRRTEKSIWFLGWDGKEVRRKPETVSMLGERFEVIRYDDLSIVRACDVVAETIEVKETVKTEIITEVIDETQSVNEEESKKIERRKLINQFNHYATLLHQTDEDSPKWYAIFDKTQELRAAIEKLG